MTPDSLYPFVHLADSAWVLPLAAGVWLVLVLQGQWRAAWRWPVAVLLAMAVIVAGKLAFDLFGLAVPRWQLYNVSGHAMFAALLYPTLVGLIFSGFSRAWRGFGVALGVLLAAALAAALVWRLDHTLAETLLGAVVGLLASAWVLWQRPQCRWHWSLVLLALPLAGYLLWHQVYHPVHQSRQAVWAQVAQWLQVDHRYTRRILRDPATGAVSVTVRQIRLRST